MADRLAARHWHRTAVSGPPSLRIESNGGGRAGEPMKPIAEFQTHLCPRLRAENSGHPEVAEDKHLPDIILGSFCDMHL